MANSGGKVTALRRGATLLVMNDLTRETKNKGWLTLHEVYGALRDAVDTGDIAWCQNDWDDAPTKPYHGGTGQHLVQLATERYGLLEYSAPTSERRTSLYRLTAAARELMPQLRREQHELQIEMWTCQCGTWAGAPGLCGECRTARAPDLLPPPAFEQVAADYERTTGCAVIFGVTDDLERVIRIKTLRGMVEHKLPDEMPWRDAVDEWLGG